MGITKLKYRSNICQSHFNFAFAFEKCCSTFLSTFHTLKTGFGVTILQKVEIVLFIFHLCFMLPTKLMLKHQAVFTGT